MLATELTYKKKKKKMRELDQNISEVYFPLYKSKALGGGWQTFSIKGQIVSILDFVDHMASVSVTTSQHCCRVKTVIENMKMSGQGCSNEVEFMDIEILILYNFM